MTEILTLEGAPADLADGAEAAVRALEAGGLVLLPDAPFTLSPDEAALADPAILADGSKNVSLEPRTGQVSGHAAGEGQAAVLEAMMRRYAAFADGLLATLLPGYAAAVERRRTSFRPAAIDARALSPRKDDKRLHVDAFPSSPVGDRRILRVFTNVDPLGRDRVWRVGDRDFGTFAAEFGPRLTRGGGLGRSLLHRLGVTRGRRTAYDQAMLELHDLAKLDDGWQAATPRTELTLPAGTSWIVFTDAVLHAAMSGCNAFEQTYLLPVTHMREPSLSPLRTLERMLERPLA